MPRSPALYSTKAKDSAGSDGRSTTWHHILLLPLGLNWSSEMLWTFVNCNSYLSIICRSLVLWNASSFYWPICYKHNVSVLYSFWINLGLLASRWQDVGMLVSNICCALCRMGIFMGHRAKRQMRKSFPYLWREALTALFVFLHFEFSHVTFSKYKGL